MVRIIYKGGFAALFKNVLINFYYNKSRKINDITIIDNCQGHNQNNIIITGIHNSYNIIFIE